MFSYTRIVFDFNGKKTWLVIGSHNLSRVMEKPVFRISDQVLHKHSYTAKEDGTCKTYIPLDGDPATIRNFGQNSSNRSRNGKSVEEAW